MYYTAIRAKTKVHGPVFPGLLHCHCEGSEAIPSRVEWYGYRFNPRFRQLFPMGFLFLEAGDRDCRRAKQRRGPSDGRTTQGAQVWYEHCSTGVVPWQGYAGGGGLVNFTNL
jgi:hypothetical protein